MIWIELGCLAIVAFYYIAQALHTPHRARFFGQIALLSTASWLGEQSMIMAYGFYSYAPTWDLFIGHVPLFIILIWPVVIHSAWRLAKLLCGTQRRWIPILGVALVLADASLIEPVCVHAGFWRWYEPGLFQVPLLGIFGWAVFAGWCIWILEATDTEEDQKKQSFKHLLHMLWLPALACHLILLALWWGGMRWLTQTIPDLAGVTAAWLLLLPTAYFVWHKKLSMRVPLRELMLRLPGACFFFFVLWLYQGPALLFAYIFAFVPPYLALMHSPKVK